MTVPVLQNTWKSLICRGNAYRDEEGLEEAGYDVLRSMKQENVIYSEIRFRPTSFRDR